MQLLALLSWGLLVALGATEVNAADTGSPSQAPKRLLRADSFLGIHFDFHAGVDCKEIGKNTTPAMVDKIVDLVHPDYLQIDCKGHPGLSSYPTRAGNQAPGFVGDPLRVWREATARRGVALYMHYSGVWDSEAIRRNPSWAAVNADGKTNGNATSFFGPYVDQLLIPQLRELAGVYGVDGAWVDGDCWAAVADYSVAALQAFRASTGIREVPRGVGQPNWREFLAFHREAYRRYLRHYTTELKKSHPEMQLCSNWAFSDLMPEPVSAPVDFLSGDYSPEDSVNSARFSARCLARQQKPWDLMAWSFTRTKGKNGSNQKTVVQLQREAAVVLALGGGFQAYFQQKRDGSVYEERLPVIAEVAKFCRARQSWCHRASQLPQVALLYSTAGHYQEMNSLFGSSGPGVAALKGTLQALLESQNSIEVLSEHRLAGKMQAYPLIIVPEWQYLEPAFKDELVAYAKNGGNLLVMGPTVRLFEAELGVQLTGEPVPASQWSVRSEDLKVPLEGRLQMVNLAQGTRALGMAEPAQGTNGPAPAASVRRLGKGNIAGLYFTFGQPYLARHDPAARRFLSNLVGQLFPTPLVTVTGSSDVDVTVNRLDRRLAVNLVNTSGPHAGEPILESIAPTGPLSVSIRQSTKPSKVTLQPAGKSLDFTYRSGVVEVKVPGVEIHDIVVVE